MAIRNNKLGGNDFTDGEVLYDYDLDDTINAVIEFSAKGQAQIPFTTLKSTGNWENEGNLAADRTTDSNGSNNTINTSSTTAGFDTDNYSNILSQDYEFTNSGFDTDDQVTSFTITCTALTKGYISRADALLVNTSDVTVSIEKNGTQVASKTQTNVGDAEVRFEPTDYSELLENGDTIDIIYTTPGLTRVILNKSYSGSYFELSGQTFPGETRGIQFQKYDFTNSVQIIVDTNTLNFKGNENVIFLYTPSSIPPNTSIKATINDGTQDISANAILSENDTTVIPITLTPTQGNNIEIHYTLESTDGVSAVEWYGYGVYRY